MKRVVWQPVEEDRLTLLLLDEHGIGLTVYENGRVLTVSTDAGGADMRLAEQYRLCIATEVDEPVAIPVEAIETLLSWRGHGKAYDTVRTWLDSLKGGQG